MLSPATTLPLASEKRAERIAASIEEAILADRVHVGERLGNEAEIAHQHGVSRWTIREAIAILEQAGCVVSRRGANGGIFVTAPASELTRNAIGTYIGSLHLPIDTIIQTRLVLETLAVRYAIERLDPLRRAALAGLVLQAEQGGGVRVAAMGTARELVHTGIGDARLATFLGSLGDLVMVSAWTSALDDVTYVSIIDRLALANRKLILAILANDYDLAMQLEHGCLNLIREMHSASSVLGGLRSVPHAIERTYAVYPTARPAKKGERVASQIRRLIADEELAPGTNLGSEAALMAEYDVGRPVLREAIRTLERLGLCTMQRGGASGLTVTTPDPNRVVAIARSFLSRLPDNFGGVGAVRDALVRVPPNAATNLMLAIIDPD